MRPRTRYAPTLQRSARLSDDFGLALATRWFGAEAIASLPLLEAGPNRGKPKGTLNWRTTTVAGYHPSAGTAVAANTMVRAWIAEGFAHEDAAMSGMWMGRMQPLCGSRDVLTAAYREHDAAARAAVAADIDAMRADLLRHRAGEG